MTALPWQDAESQLAGLASRCSPGSVERALALLSALRRTTDGHPWHEPRVEPSDDPVRGVDLTWTRGGDSSAILSVAVGPVETHISAGGWSGGGAWERWETPDSRTSAEQVAILYRLLWPAPARQTAEVAATPEAAATPEVRRSEGRHSRGSARGR